MLTERTKIIFYETIIIRDHHYYIDLNGGNSIAGSNPVVYMPAMYRPEQLP